MCNGTNLMKYILIWADFSDFVWGGTCYIIFAL